MNNAMSKFNEALDLESIKQGIAEVNKNDTKEEFEDVPVGTYDVEIERLEMVETKKAPARPMLSVWFNIVEGKYKGQKLFMNQVITSPFPIHLAIEFLKSLESGVSVSFEDYGQFADTILDVNSKIEGERIYSLTYGVNDAGFDEYKIDGVFSNDVKDADSDLPF